MSGPYMLAVSTDTPDGDYPSLAAMARAIVARRDADGGGRIKIVTGMLARDALPNGRMLAVRRLDGSAHGALIGYAFLPINGGAGSFRGADLMAAIEAAS